MAERPVDWYRDAVIYEIHVRAFRDSTGDGVGDFPGLIEKLDYLVDLGVDTLWLLPFYPSPLRDDGYDIADYTGVHPDYGTRDDVVRLIDEAHARGLRVITELVINHTSDQHPWFRRAIAAPPDSPERDFYVWSDTPERYGDVRVIFSDFENSNWAWHPEAGAYYWHRFYSHQPDLNFDNPLVADALFGVLDDWAALGVDGFRLDAVPYLFERDGTNGENLPETHDFLRRLRAHLDRAHPGVMLLAEANQWPEDAAAYFGDGDECHMNFHFPLMPRLYMAAAQEDRFSIVDILDQTPELPDPCQWAMFLRNHDELTLEMVTDDERDAMYRAYAADPRMRVNLGIRRRLAPLLGNDRRLIELMNSLLFSLPGTPVIYYGDEIGMGDNIYLGDRNGVRTPMQWSPDRNAGFSEANPQRLYLPVVIDPEFHYETVNVEAQMANPRSLWWWMKRMIALRRRHPVLGRGRLEMLHPDNTKVLAFVRHDDNERLLVVANLSRHPQPCSLDLSPWAGLTPVELTDGTAFPWIGDGDYPLTLGPHECFWFSLEARPQHLRPSGPEPAVSGDGPELVRLQVHETWTDVLAPPHLRRLEPVLAQHLLWWHPGELAASPIEKLSVLDALDVDAGVLLIARVERADGTVSDHVVSLAFVNDEEGNVLVEHDRAAAFAHLDVISKRRRSGMLVDATRLPAFASRLLALTARAQLVEGSTGVLTGRPEAPLLPHAVTRGPRRVELLPATVVRAGPSHTSLRYGDSVIAKVQHRLGTGELDALLGRAGAERPAPVPTLAGTLEYKPDAGGPARTVMIAQCIVPGAVDAWFATLDELARFAERAMADPPRDISAEQGRWLSPIELATQIPEGAGDLLGPFGVTFEQIGRRLLELHQALAAVPGQSTIRLGALDRRSTYQSLRNTARQGLRAAGRRARELPDRLGERVVALAGQEASLLDKLLPLREPGFEILIARTHGNAHLGQVLLSGGDATFVDLASANGESLERLRMRPPIRDVAGVLISIEHASAHTLRQQTERGVVEQGSAAYTDLRGWLASWSRWAGALVVRGWIEEPGARSFGADRPQELATLLDAFVVERAVQELLDALGRRPVWIEVPLQTLERLANPD
ncbi:MAG: maltose alpha-D-glucosyltransferase [Actinomycetota bacterium]|nr:MAG: maltose alpha-D-glucosyltransferase [Actinomycetota bacterium]